MRSSRQAGWVAELHPTPAPAPAFRESVNVLFTGPEEIQKVHAHVFAGLADAQEHQILLTAFWCGKADNRAPQLCEGVDCVSKRRAVQRRRGRSDLSHPTMENVASHLAGLIRTHVLGNGFRLGQPSGLEMLFFRKEIGRAQERVRGNHQAALRFVITRIGRRAHFAPPFGQVHCPKHFTRIDDPLHYLRNVFMNGGLRCATFGKESPNLAPKTASERMVSGREPGNP